MYQSIVAPFGAQPCPTIEVTLRSLLRIDEDQPFAAEAVEILFHHAADEHRGDAGIEGVAALQQHLERRSARQRMAGGDGAVRPGNGRAIGGARDGGRPENHESSQSTPRRQRKGVPACRKRTTRTASARLL